MLDDGLCTPQEERALRMLRTLHADTDGSALGVAARDDVSGLSRMCGGMVRLEQGRLRQSVDIRYPAAMDGERLRAALCALAENASGSFEPGAMRAPFCIDPNSPEIRTLTNTYNELANRSDAPFAIGEEPMRAGLQMRSATVPARRTSPALFGRAPPTVRTEAMEMAQLYKALRIYILAIARLMKLERFEAETDGEARMSCERSPCRRARRKERKA